MRQPRWIVWTPCRVVACLGLAILAQCAGVGAVPAGTLQDFLDRCDTAVRRVEAARQTEAPLGDPEALFPPGEEVPVGRTVAAIDHAALRAEWRTVPGEGEARRRVLEQLRERLLAVRAEAARAAPATGETPGGVPGESKAFPAGWREKLSEILARPEFKKGEARTNLYQQIWAWLMDWLGALLPGGTSAAVGRLLESAVFLLAGAALVALFVVLVRVAIPLLRRERQPAAGPASSGQPVRETPEMLLALARDRSQAGDLRGAAQAMFRWLLTTLQRMGRLDYDPALTNREHLARFRGDTAARAGFADLTAQFERTWYGLGPIDPDGYQAFFARCHDLAGGRG